MDDFERKIRERAYQLWMQEGRPHGRDVAHWLEAERSTDEQKSPQGMRRKPAGSGRKAAARPRNKSAPSSGLK